MGLRDEIREQPDVARRLIASARDCIAPVAAAIRARAPEFAVIAARGTSDHAAIYAQYVFGVRHRMPVALAAPSIQSLYGVAPRFERAVVIGISQSGASPDVVGVVAAARGQGALTVALTNEPGSALADAAEHVIDLAAGSERAVAATKTYTAELLALALLSAAMGDDAAAIDEVAGLPDALERALLQESAVQELARGEAATTRAVVLGRGFNYATAREWALKLKEIADVLADPYSSADFQHGPLALIQPGFLVLAVAPAGPSASDVAPLLRRLRDGHGAHVVAISGDAAIARAVDSSIDLPAGVPEWLTPIPAIVPAQLFALHLALAKGRDPEAPRHLQKVTLTR